MSATCAFKVKESKVNKGVKFGQSPTSIGGWKIQFWQLTLFPNVYEH